MFGKIYDLYQSLKDLADSVDTDLMRKGADFLASIDKNDTGIDDRAAQLLRQIADWIDGDKAGEQ